MLEKSYTNKQIAERLLTNGTARRLKLISDGKCQLAIGNTEYTVGISGMIGVVDHNLIWWNMEDYPEPQEFEFYWNNDTTTCFGFFQDEKGHSKEIVVTPCGAENNTPMKLILCFETEESMWLLYFHSAGGSFEIGRNVRQKEGMRMLWEIFDIMYEKILSDFRIEKATTN